MSAPLRIVVVGGVAAGPKAAARARRLAPDAEITIIERDEFLSYAGCGLPYYIGGSVATQEDLMSTPIGVVRDPDFFQKAKAIRVLNRTEAVGIDRDAKELEIRSLATGETTRLAYDKLVVATGATPVAPPIEGSNLSNIFRLKDMHDAEGIKRLCAGACRPVAIIGAGLIGMEMAEAFAECGHQITVVELLPQILPMLDSDMALLTQRHLESHGVTVMTGTRVLRMEGDGNVERVVTDRGEIDSEIVLLSIGIRPQVSLAADAGLLIGPSGGIHVNEYMQTSDPSIYAVGDCAEKLDIVSGMASFAPLGSVANKEGRAAGTNITGGVERFGGITGTAAVKIFDFNVGRAGMTEAQARNLGYDATSVLVPGPDRAHFYPGAKPIFIKLVVDRPTRKLIGIQAIGLGDVTKRVDVAVVAMTAGMTVDQVAGLDLAYAPPYNAAMDPITTAANVARNLLDGLFRGVSTAEVRDLIEAGDDIVLLDVRSPGEHAASRIAGSTLIPLGAVRAKAGELPKDKPIVAFCKSSLRAYEAAQFLAHEGFHDLRIMQGGMMAWPYETESGS